MKHLESRITAKVYMMKKLLLLFAALLLPLLASAHDFEVGRIYYNITSEADKTAEVTYKGNNPYQGGWYSGSITIPATVTYDGVAYSVTSIGSYAFYKCSSLTSITLPKGVTSIGEDAFGGCSSLTAINIPEGVTSIGNYAFRACRSLTAISIPEGVTRIRDRAFESCSNLTAINIPEGVTSIGYAAFVYCSSLTSITIPKSVTSIGSEAFYGCSSLTAITLPEGVTSIGDYVFAYCSRLTAITIPASVTSIGSYAFASCNNLQNLYCHAGKVPTTNSNAFDSSNLANATLHVPTSLLSSYKNKAPWSNFGNFAAMKVAVSNITLNRSSANLTEGETLPLIATIKPSHADNTSVSWSSSNSSVASVDANGKVTAKAVGTATIIAKANDGSGVSASCVVTVKKKVVLVSNITLNQSTATLTEGGTLTLTATVTPSNADNTSVSWSSSNTSVATVDSKGKVTAKAAGSATITAKANDGSGVKASCVVTVKSAMSGICGSNLTWRLTTAGELIIEGTGAMTNYTNYSKVPWYEYKERIYTATIDEGVTSIGDYALALCSSLTSFTIPESVTSIGDYAFAWCSSLTSLIIPESITSIGGNAFTFCSSLTTIKVASGNTIYDSRDGCNAIIETSSNTLIAGCSSTIIPSSVTSIEYDAFRCCRSLTSITIPSSVTSIGDYAFYSCSSLTTITIPTNSKLTSIGINAFVGCSITTLTIPVSMTSIREGAFSGCSGLTEIYCYAEKVPSVGSGAFDSSILANATLHVPASTLNDYKTTAPWSSFGSFKTIETFVTDITLNKSTATLTEGGTLTLTATVTPSNADNTSVSWSSSNSSVASVDNTGKVTAKAAGTATITATANDGSGVKASCVVTVKKKVVLVSNITLNQTSATLTEGGTLTLTATIKPNDATDKTISWSSSNSSVATVDSKGKVTAKAAGTATITATANDGSGVKASCKVVVEKKVVPVTSITLSQSTATLIEDETLSLTATVKPTNATNKGITWSSSDSSVASVDSEGQVTAKAVGSATITAKANDGSGVSATCVVTVKRKVVLVSNITLNQTTAILTESGTLTLTATVTPSNADNTSVSWSSSNTSVATVDANGKVTAKAAGTATITATANDGSGVKASCVVTVEKKVVPVTSITLSQSTATLTQGESLTLAATVMPSDATAKTVTWSSSNTSVAPVDSEGQVTAKAAGTATITAKANDGSGVSATCVVTVMPAMSGSCGSNLTWRLTEAGELIIEGTGAMTNYTNESDAPWYVYQADIYRVAIHKGVTSIGDYAFNYCYKLTSVTIPACVTSVGKGAFAETVLLATVNYDGTIEQAKALFVDAELPTGCQVKCSDGTYTQE